MKPSAEELLREARDALEPGTGIGPDHMNTLEGRTAWLDRTRALRSRIDAYLAAPQMSAECICPKCGIRHGGTNVSDPGF